MLPMQKNLFEGALNHSHQLRPIDFSHVPVAFSILAMLIGLRELQRQAKNSGHEMEFRARLSLVTSCFSCCKKHFLIEENGHMQRLCVYANVS